MDASVLPSFASGVDRVYVGADVDPVLGVAAGRELASIRTDYVAVTGIEPPPIAIALLVDPLNLRTPHDREGRPVWTIDAPQFARDGDLSLIAHEQTHAILRRRFPEDARARFVEEGLGNLVAHLVMKRAAHRSRVVEAMRSVLEVAALAPTVDLLELGARFDPKRYASAIAFMQAMCKRADDGTTSLSFVGYALGLAYWLDRSDRRPTLLREVVAKKPLTLDALFAITEAGEEGLSARQIDVAAAHVVLVHHASLEEGRALETGLRGAAAR
jgi:hypothetical protein